MIHKMKTDNKMDKKLKELSKKANSAQEAFITADALYDASIAYLDTANGLYDDAERIVVAASKAVDTAYGIANKANNKANRASIAYLNEINRGGIK